MPVSNHLSEMYERILVPTDGSTGTAHVALQAIDIARQYGATLHVLSVVDTSDGSLLSEVARQCEELERQRRTDVERIKRMVEATASPR